MEAYAFMLTILFFTSPLWFPCLCVLAYLIVYGTIKGDRKGKVDEEAL